MADYDVLVVGAGNAAAGLVSGAVFGRLAGASAAGA
jgi:hypothetical protein